MIPKLTTEQREALAQSAGPVRIEDEQGHRVYFLVDESTFINLQQREDLAAVREGIADIQAGRVVALETLDSRVQRQLGLAD